MREWDTIMATLDEDIQETCSASADGAADTRKWLYDEAKKAMKKCVGNVFPASTHEQHNKRLMKQIDLHVPGRIARRP